MFSQTLKDIPSSDSETKEAMSALQEEETALILARWQEQLDESTAEIDISEILAGLEEERIELLRKEQAKEDALLALKKEYTRFMNRQEELVLAIKSVDTEVTIDSDEESLLEDSIQAWEESQHQNDLQTYMRDLSEIEQALARMDLDLQYQWEDIRTLRERRYEIDLEIEDIQMIHGIPQIITNIDD